MRTKLSLIHKTYFSLFLVLLTQIASAASIRGTVKSGDEQIVGASIYINSLNVGARTNAEGVYQIIDLPAGQHEIRVSFVGYMTIVQTFELTENQNLTINFELEEDALRMNDVVVSATRTQIARYDAPVIVQTISDRTFEATQSLSIAEGLSFSPGLRLENNCQNCGFTQLRMNGLDGAYSQILINSRPVFSALAGVYGLEMLPANMVDRIEVVRGGGSVLYGGNAIAGTVNIITKDPFQNSFEIGMNQSFINMQASDRTFTFNAALVSEDFNKGITFFGFRRDRQHWDANGDGFSEITQLNNQTFGFDAFWNTSKRSKIKLGLYYITEFRRGGNNFNLAPHQTDLAEQLKHNILSTNASFEHYSKDFRHKFSVYTSAQFVNRDSYYGAGGRILSPNDSLTESDILAINAYGVSQDFSLVSGVQYNYEFSKNILFTSGAEYNFNKVKDAMPGYQRAINQTVGTLGSYAQLELKPFKKLTVLLGGRFDYVQINGVYDFNNARYDNKKDLQVFVPRVSAMYQIHKNWKVRSSFAQGYRGPQAFDEDLHLETVGGAARFIVLAPDLQTERSNSATISLNYEKMVGKRQMTFVAEAFYTQLNNPFILSGQEELPNGVSVITKRNGSGAAVKGVNLEANVAFGSKWILQSGGTIQTATYQQAEEIWAPEDENDPTPAAVTTRMLRTPNAYGYLTLVYNPNKQWAISYSSVFTGSMDVPHVIDPESEQTVIKSTPVFFENNLKIAYTIKLKDDYRLQIFGGVQNIFNSYQRDFDLGMFRDAGYVYGPNRPRTVFFGVKMGMR
jgi:outer membrane receptor for ferrienterochelin and colicins